MFRQELIDLVDELMRNEHYETFSHNKLLIWISTLEKELRLDCPCHIFGYNAEDCPFLYEEWYCENCVRSEIWCDIVNLVHTKGGLYSANSFKNMISCLYIAEKLRELL